MKLDQLLENNLSYGASFFINTIQINCIDNVSGWTTDTPEENLERDYFLGGCDWEPADPEDTHKCGNSCRRYTLHIRWRLLRSFIDGDTYVVYKATAWDTEYDW